MDQSDDIKKSIGAVLRKLRKHHSLTQQEVSDKTGVGRSHLPQVELGDKMPSVEVIMRLAAAFNILPSTLLKEIESECQNRGIEFPLSKD